MNNTGYIIKERGWLKRRRLKRYHKKAEPKSNLRAKDQKLNMAIHRMLHSRCPKIAYQSWTSQRWPDL